MVRDGVQHRGRALGQLPRIPFEVFAQRAEGAVPPVPYGHHEVGAGEDHDLAGVDDLAGGRQFGVFDVRDGLEDGEQDIAVVLDLGSLMGLDGVLDGERMQAEQLRDPRELRLGGLVQAEPDEAVAPAVAAALPYPGHRLLDAGGRLLADAVLVDHTVDDGGTERGAGRVAEVHTVPAACQACDFAQVADHRHAVLLPRNGRPVCQQRVKPRSGHGSSGQPAPGGVRAS